MASIDLLDDAHETVCKPLLVQYISQKATQFIAELEDS